MANLFVGLALERFMKGSGGTGPTGSTGCQYCGVEGGHGFHCREYRLPMNIEEAIATIQKFIKPKEEVLAMESTGYRNVPGPAGSISLASMENIDYENAPVPVESPTLSDPVTAYQQGYLMAMTSVREEIRANGKQTIVQWVEQQINAAKAFL